MVQMQSAVNFRRQILCKHHWKVEFFKPIEHQINRLRFDHFEDFHFKVIERMKSSWKSCGGDGRIEWWFGECEGVHIGSMFWWKVITNSNRNKNRYQRCHFVLKTRYLFIDVFGVCSVFHKFAGFLIHYTGFWIFLTSLIGIPFDFLRRALSSISKYSSLNSFDQVAFGNGINH